MSEQADRLKERTFRFALDVIELTKTFPAEEPGPTVRRQLAKAATSVGANYRAASEPMKAGAVGLLIQLLFFPVLIATIVVMVVTIIGIPLFVLVPFALLAFALLFLIGFTAVAYDVGRLAVSRFGGEGRNPYFAAAIGIALVLSPVLLSRLVGFGGLLWSITWTLLLLGLVTEYVAWTVGLGAVALVRFDRQ